MATDATGTPSINFSIPKFNTSVDAPSGLGLNAIVDDIDAKLGLVSTLLGALARVKVRKNSGADVGSRRRLNLIEGSGITLTIADDAANEEVDITIAASAGSSLVTALPGAPTDGQEIIFTDSLTAPAYYWHLRYNSTTTKWHFVGGSPLSSEIDTSESTASTSYTDLATVGPSITAPLAGVYDLEYGFGDPDGVGVTFASPKLGAATAVDADNVTGLMENVARKRRKTLAASDVVKLQYRANSGTRPAAKRWLTLTPVKLG